MKIKKFQINFLILFLGITVVSYLTREILNLSNLIYNSLSDKLSVNQINEYFELQDKLQWVSYVFIPVVLLIKTTIIAYILYIGAFFYSKIKVTFKQLFNDVVKAEFIFLLVGVCKIIWFYFFQTNYTLEDLQYFYPLSALNIVGYQGLEPWFIYPLQVLNLFELAYWFVLAYFIGKLAFTEKDKGKPMDLGLKIVASSYGSALLLWVVVVMFFTLNYS
ncbi:MAG: hypothetical protein CVU07_00515 [Bacteroidetes bacterium HGW-Bacteroidetes-23]|nr:MAG: hypothetical protein CVU07_00515 [Bacteroidetes bacterium HGW-Bacteroidetes-23]